MTQEGRGWRAPAYEEAGDCQLVALSRRRPLRSVEQRVCYVPRQNSTFGDHSFAAADPRTWNELPFSLRDTGYCWLLSTTSENMLILRRILRPWHICDIYDLFVPCINLLTHLLTLSTSLLVSCCVASLWTTCTHTVTHTHTTCKSWTKSTQN